MYLSIIFLPLLGSIISGFFGRKVGISGAQFIASSFVVTTTILSVLAFFEVGLNNIPVSFSLFRWIDSESFNIFWGFRFDSLTVSMLIPVLIVSSLVHIYSIGYMKGDPHNQRFFSYLSLFTFMMIILVTANNFLLMFVGWEGVGICSYLLVNFWYTRIAANQSSVSAFLTNRVGDCFLTVGMFALLWSFGNIDYTTVFSLAPYINENIITLIGICLLIGAMAKSSQIGLHVWLPMAMEGPTPVSALIHAATMVTAGVYLLMRCSPLIEYSSTALIFCLWIGAITTVFSSLIGLFQQDIKKVIAYSTMSQLGMMVIAVGLSSYNIALFHLVNHAFYKALLFLGAGSVIHAVSDNQDFRKYGGLRAFLPLTYSVMLIASLSLVAFPFMTGFYSKDFILETAYGQFSLSGIAVYFIATIGAMFTTLYSVKILYLTFITNPNGSLVDYKQVHEGDIFMSFPLMILAVFSIFFGFITKDIFIGIGSDFFEDNALFIHPSHEIMLDTEFAVPTLFKLLPLIFTISLSFLSIILSEFLPKLLLNFKFSNMGYNIFSFFNQRFFIELFYNKYITNLVLKLGGQTTKILDKGSIEYFGPFGLEKGLINLSNNISNLDTGIVTSYALYILIGFIIYILLSYLYIFNIYYLLIITMCVVSLNNISHMNRKKKADVIVIESNIFSTNIFIKLLNWKTLIIGLVFTIIYILCRYLYLMYEVDVFDVINNTTSIFSILEVLIIVIPMLLVVAFVTVAERKTMASMQRRLGPNIVGFYGLLQAFADALKLLLKEYISPTQSNLILFFIGPVITLIFALLGYAVIPLSPGLSIFDFNLGILYLLAVSSLSTYGILLAGWSANSKYAFLGSLRSTAQLISYELILSSAILLVILLTASLNLSVVIETQRAIWFIVPLFPVFIIFFIGSIAETNRAPFDLAEAESELVSGFMTEHAAVIFVFFFLAEYASIVLICIFTTILFLGGYLFNIDISVFIDFIQYINFDLWIQLKFNKIVENILLNSLVQNIFYAFILGLKSSIMIFIFIWARASLPRIRFDQLMSFCWTVLLPTVIALIIIVPCIIYSFEIIPNNIVLF